MKNGVEPGLFILNYNGVILSLSNDQDDPDFLFQLNERAFSHAVPRRSFNEAREPVE